MATAKKAAPKAAAKKTVTKPVSVLKPIKETFNKTSLVAHLVQTSGAEPKMVKAVLGSLEATIFASLSKKGAGAFTWPGVLKVTATHVPAKKARKGVDPFTKVERMFAAKPASVKVKARFFKKVKDAAL
jgi:nucleoid DNA-binding protein